MPSDPALADRFCGAAGGVESGIGNPATHIGGVGGVKFVAVPLVPLLPESPTTVPLPSFIPQRPMRPAADVISVFLAAKMSPAERATFQTRASSRTPLKNPEGDGFVPEEVIAIPSPAC